MIQKHVSWLKPLRTPFILFIHLQMSRGTALFLFHPQDGNVKQEVLRGRVMLPRPRWECCETGHSSLWSPLRDWQIWGDISKALCENRQQNAPHGVHVLVERRERGHQEDGLMQSLSRSETHYGVLNSLAFSQLEKGRPSKKVIQCSVAGHWCNIRTAFHLPHRHGFTKQIGDAGTGLYSLGYEICLEHASTSRNLS